MRRSLVAALAALIGVLPVSASAQDETGWRTAWVGSVQGPYPVGNPSAQPDQRFALPDPARGANDQTFRMVVRPTLWGRQTRVRLSNAFGTRPITFDGLYAGLQQASAELVPGTNRQVLFAGKDSVTIPPGGSAWSDAVDLPFVADMPTRFLAGRKLAVSLHVVGESGPMTWHAKAMQTSYITAPGAGGRGGDESEGAFRYTVSSWFFLDALDMRAPAATPVVVAFGDSITDGTASTMNTDDRWPDVLIRRLATALGRNRIAVVNAGIGGNQVVGPAEYGPDKPFPGGPSALSRLSRDVLELSGVTTVIWLEGINDFSQNGRAEVEAVERGLREGVARLHARGIRVVGATVTSALGSTNPGHGSPEQDEKRKALNAFIRSSGVFDAVVDFDAATLDPATGGMKAEFVPESTTGGPGDKLHPNRAGYQAMGAVIAPNVVIPDTKP